MKNSKPPWEATFDSQVAMRFVMVRNQLGITQQKASELLGTSRSNVASKEIGRHGFSLGEISRFCSVTGVSIETFMQGIVPTHAVPAEEVIRDADAAVASKISALLKHPRNNLERIEKLLHEVNEKFESLKADAP